MSFNNYGYVGQYNFWNGYINFAKPKQLNNKNNNFLF